ncbi:MAG: D-alanyl-D-alanine carboxypeptidase [Deltaproteobacteria bacterium]|nr:D-alanyl-D-alanine carboxypeptidase [Deltaproteobacteria bacterium]
MKTTRTRQECGGGEVPWMRMWWIGIVVGTALIIVDGITGQSLAYKAKEVKIARPIPRIEKTQKKALPRVTREKQHESRSISALRSSGTKWYRIHVPLPVAKQKPVAQRKRPAPVVIREVVHIPPPEPDKDFQSMLLADADSGQLLLAENIDRQWPTASLAKMMVGLLAMEDIEGERLSLRTPVAISARATRARGRTINLRAGEVFPLGELLKAMIVTSANDATVAVAERLRGSVEACVAAMNRKARLLGMSRTRYQTVNGMPLPGGAAGDVSSARDSAVLGMELIRYNRILRWTSVDQVPFRDGAAMLPNTNHLVGRVDGVNGLKTGFTVKARYNLVATAQRGDKSLIVVVLGGRNSRVRFDAAEEFLEWGFTHDVPRADIDESWDHNNDAVGSSASAHAGSQF